MADRLPLRPDFFAGVSPGSDKFQAAPLGDHVYSRLHRYVETGELGGFGMIYLGQQDHRLPYRPPDLVTRDEVREYPTDFAPISAKDLGLLTKRGEQLTHIIIDRYLSQL